MFGTQAAHDGRQIEQDQRVSVPENHPHNLTFTERVN
jgi:hypothetical protein